MNKKGTWELILRHCTAAWILFLLAFAGLRPGSVHLVSFIAIELEKLALSGMHQSCWVSTPTTFCMSGNVDRDSLH